MELEQIKAAVDTGLRVCWMNEIYAVIKDGLGQYLIAYSHGTSKANYIGLTWNDGETLNGREDEFFVPADQLSYLVDEQGTEGSLDEYREAVLTLTIPGSDRYPLRYRYVAFQAGFERVWVAVQSCGELPETDAACELAIDLLLKKKWFADEGQTEPEIVI